MDAEPREAARVDLDVLMEQMRGYPPARIAAAMWDWMEAQGFRAEAHTPTGDERELRRLRNIEKDYDTNFPCDGGCSTNDGPEETCSRHGRSPRDLWQRLDAATTLIEGWTTPDVRGSWTEPQGEPSDARVQQMQDELEYRVRTAAALAKGGHDIDVEVRAGRARIGKLAFDLGKPQGETSDAQVLEGFLGKLAGDGAYTLDFSSAASLHDHIVRLLKRDIAALRAAGGVR